MYSIDEWIYHEKEAHCEKNSAGGSVSVADGSDGRNRVVVAPDTVHRGVQCSVK